ncbi:MAG: hypothetical protein EOO94_02165, partial [Pedobacter sp.]
MKNRYNKTIALSCTMAVLGLALFPSCKKELDHTTDTGNPVVVSYNPTSSVEGVAVTSNLVLTFDEIIKKAEGTIVIASAVDTQRVSMNSDAVSISADKHILTIDPPKDLESDEMYTVTLD